jgi:hypothetical protein
MTRAVLILFGLLALSADVGTNSARAQDPNYFSLRVCNNSGVDVSVALSTLVSASDARYHVFGWYTVNPGCRDLGGYARPYFYIYAEQYYKQGSYKYWPGNFPLCVQYPGPFDWVHTSGRNCSANELKMFTEVRIDPNTGLMTFNLN